MRQHHKSLRLTDGENAAFTHAAAKAGGNFSWWAIDRLLVAARNELREAGVRHDYALRRREPSEVQEAHSFTRLREIEGRE